MCPRKFCLTWLIAVALAACNDQAVSPPIDVVPTTEIPSATFTAIPPTSTPIVPGTPTIASPTAPRTTLATIASITPPPTSPLARPVPTPSPSSTALAQRTPSYAPAAPPVATSEPCNCPTDGAAKAPVHPGYQLVTYSCVKNYLQADYWPPDLYASEEANARIEGNDETAWVNSWSGTEVSNYVMNCRITLYWRYQPIGQTQVPPSPRAYVTPVGELSQVLRMISTEYRDSKTIAQHLGIATGTERAVWLSTGRVNIIPEYPESAKYGGQLIRRLDNNQVYILRLQQQPGATAEAIWKPIAGIPRQDNEIDFLGTLQRFEVQETCRDSFGRQQKCWQDGLVLWSLEGGERIVYVLYSDGRRDTINSNLGWITHSCLGRINNQKICAIKSDGNVDTPLTDDLKYDGFARWSPDGSRIAFVSDRSGNQEIYVLDADGIERITFAPGNDSAPAWSTDGKRIAFVSRRDGNAEIYTTLPDGREQRVSMATSSPSDEDNPTWSPDGRIAFDSNRDGQRRIYVTNPGGTVTRITNGSNDYAPAWSPDGKRIVFVRREISEDLYLINADGTGETRLTNNNYPDHYPVWSPDNKSIAYCVYLPNVAPDTLYVMDVATKKFAQLGDGVLGCPFSWR